MGQGSTNTLEHPSDWLPASHQRFVDVDGVRTRCFEAGAGETVVLIHGGQFGSGYSLDAWSLTLASLARWCHVVAFDRLGQGQTDNPPDDAYTAPAVLAHADAFLAAAGIEECHLVGHSRGAFVATWLAVHGRARVRSLTAVSSNTLAPEDPQLPSGAFYRALEPRQAACVSIAERVRLEPAEQTFSPAAVSDDFYARLTQIAELPKTRHADALMAAGQASAWRQSIDAERARLWERIDAGALTVPTLIAWGRDDRSAPVVLAQRLFERLAPTVEEILLCIMNRARHYCYRDRPRMFEGALRGFMQRND